MRSPDVLVIGGGLAGMFSALVLRRAGLAVDLIERGTFGRESSWAGAGILSPLHPWRYPPAVLALAGISQQLYPAICEDLRSRTHIDPEYRRCGMLILEPDERQAADEWAVRSAARCEWLQSAALHAVEPACGLETQAIHLPDVAQVRNPRLLQALEQALRGLGVGFFADTEAREFVRVGSDITRVDTSNGAWNPGRVVIAAGAWSGELTAGLPKPLRVWPAKGEMLLFKGEPGELRRVLLKEDCYLVPRKDGRILVGSTVEDAGFDARPTAGARAKLQKTALQLMPALANCQIEKQWAGLRPASPRGIPVIGAHPGIRNLYANTGHFRHGVLSAPASAELLADLVLAGAPRLNPADYQWVENESARVV